MDRLITKEFATAVQNDFNNGIFKLEKYKFPEIVTFAIDCISILKTTSDVILNLKESVNAEYVSAWKKDVGGILLREMKRHGDENLYELKNRSYKILVKRILDEELEDFRNGGFVHVQIADSFYTIIRCISASDSYSVSHVHSIVSYESSIIDENELEPCEDLTDDNKLF